MRVFEEEKLHGGGNQLHPGKRCQCLVPSPGRAIGNGI